MEWFKKLVALALLVVWIPATLHCLLESTELLPADRCCEKSENAQHSTKDCSRVCDSLESSAFKVQDPVTFVWAPLDLILELPQNRLEIINDTRPMDSWPAPTLHLPQFLVHTSLPVRGPTFLG